MLTRQHFVLIANTISNVQNDDDRIEQMEMWIKVCKKDNPGFDEKKFRAACFPCISNAEKRRKNHLLSKRILADE